MSKKEMEVMADLLFDEIVEMTDKQKHSVMCYLFGYSGVSRCEYSLKSLKEFVDKLKKK